MRFESIEEVGEIKAVFYIPPPGVHRFTPSTAGHIPDNLNKLFVIREIDDYNIGSFMDAVWKIKK